MNETFKTQNGSLQLNEQGIAIRYSMFTKIYLAILSVVYVVWGPLKFVSYIENGDYEDLVIASIICLCFILLLYYLLSLSRNMEISYKSIKRVKITRGTILDRVMVRFELENGKRKKVYIDYNEYSIKSIESLMGKVGIEVFVSC